MTITHAILILLMIVVSWYIGYTMCRREYEPIVETWKDAAKYWREEHVAMDKWSDTLFNDDDMIRIANAAYTAGTRRDETWVAEKWIDETFSKPAEVYSEGSSGIISWG